MLFKSPLISGILIKRYKRFLADIKLDDGTEVTVHCANPGAMMGITTPGSRVLLSKSDNPKRKLPLSWEMVEIDGVWIGVNTSNPNAIVYKALLNNQIPALSGYKSIQPEVKYGKNSRIDFLLTDGPTQMCLVEVKNVHLIRVGHVAEFPDCVTARGAKHQQELLEQVQNGVRCVVLYVVQRGDAKFFKVANDLDKVYGQAALQSYKGGVEMLAYSCDMGKQGINLKAQLEYLP
jgi:sugar fermentation stimulation protein A